MKTIAEIFEQNIFTRAKDPTMFRNGFRSFHMAVTFGLTLGGGGEDSASCEYTIEQAYGAEDEDVDSGHVAIYTVKGMDVGFSIYVIWTLNEIDPRRIDSTTYYVGEQYQPE